jgi:hypothetical protein
MKKHDSKLLMQRVLLIFMIFFLVVSIGIGCDSSSSSDDSNADSNTDNGSQDNSGDDNTGDTNDDSSCKVVLLSDDFSGLLSTNWTTGTNTLSNPGGPTVAVADGEVNFTQLYDYIETKKSFSGNFNVQMDVKRISGSPQCADFYVEVVSLDGVAAIMRFRYGSDAKDSINIGKPPVDGESNTWDCIRDDSSYLEELDHSGVSEGTLTLTYNAGKVQVSFKNEEGDTISTMWMSTGSFASSKIRIWALGNSGSVRYLDNVKICSLDDEGTDQNDGNDGTCVETEVLNDTFSGPLSTNWNTGTNTKNNPGGPTVAIVNGEVNFSQLYDYIETKKSFSGDLRIEMDLERISGSPQCADFYVELVDLDGVAAIQRFRYGGDAKDSINIGKPPVDGESNTWDCIREPQYLKEMDHSGVSEGTLKLTYEDEKVQVSFTNEEGATITTSSVSAGSCSSTKVRIWALGNSGSVRYLDNVKIISLCADGSGDNSGDGSGSGSDSGSDITGVGIMPLTIGNWWDCSYDAGSISGTFRMEASATQSVSGVTATRVDYTGDLYGEDYWILVLNEGNDLNFYGDQINGTLTTPDLWCRSTFSVGDTWQTKGQGGVVNWVVISTDEKVTVGAGTFTCIHMIGTAAGGTSMADHWWAVGVGEVKLTTTMSTGVITVELEDYFVE